MSTSMRVEGDRQLKRALQALPVRVQRQVARKGLQGASSELTKAIKSATPKDTEKYDISPPGLLRKSIGRRSKTYRNTGTTVSIIGPRAGFVTDKGVKVVSLAHFVERGMPHRGIPAIPFVRRTWQAKQQQVSSRIRSDIARLVAEAARESR